MRKLVTAAAEMDTPTLYGPAQAETTYVCWGTTLGPLFEAVDQLNAAETSANVLHLTDLWPFPADAVREALERAKRVVSVEVNATAQLATLIRAQTGRAVDDTLLRYDGRAFTPGYILERLGR